MNVRCGQGEFESWRKPDQESLQSILTLVRKPGLGLGWILETTVSVWDVRTRPFFLHADAAAVHRHPDGLAAESSTVQVTDPPCADEPRAGPDTATEIRHREYNVDPLLGRGCASGTDGIITVLAL